MTSLSITVMTLNLHEGEQPSESPNSWEKRRDICVSVITSYSPTILCTQQGYEQFGISRKGSQDNTDEYCTIFYEKEKVELTEGGTFWLSESPSVPGSISWGAKAPCIATWAISWEKQGALEFLKLIFRALCLCWDRQTQDLHIDWILFRGRPLVPALCEVINDNIDGVYPSSHFPIFAEFLLPRSVRLAETPS
ncbi:DNAse I-like superfamily protein [Zea mays]|uniref:DNAse I-like superfamily protein n=1 Tax=Zea mays TaxID=4577 RepID=A0A1D6EE81_MAIZE|nr:DNAse I-like superfamily protein [Zea mays]